MIDIISERTTTFDPNKTFRGVLKLIIFQATLTRSFIDKNIQSLFDNQNFEENNEIFFKL